MRVAVTGGRDVLLTGRERHQFIHTLMHLDRGSWRALTLLHGGCHGVDQACAKMAARHEYAVEAYPADWEKHGKAAGPIREREMLKRADHLIAFRGGRGTESAIRIAGELGIEVTEIGR